MNKKIIISDYGWLDIPIENSWLKKLSINYLIFDKKYCLKKAGKNLSSKQSKGEFIGMLKINTKGCRLFKKYYNIAKLKFRNKKFYNAKSFKKAYLTDFFNFLIENKITIRCINIKRNWMEIDTKQDLKKAEKFF